MIKIRLEKWERSVVMQVLEMDESLRGKETIYTKGTTTLDILSLNSPALEATCIYLCGDEKWRDYDVATESFKTNEERDEYFDKVVATLKAWKESLKEKGETENGDKFIFEM
jgi:hypothetical protein